MRSGTRIGVSFSVLAIFALGCGPAGREDGDSGRVDTLSVLTYNLHGLLDDGPDPEWDPVRTAWLLDEIERLDPDIVGFQEVLEHLDSDGADNQIRTLADSLTARTGRPWDYRAAMSHVSWDRFREGIAILTRHPIGSSEEYSLAAKNVFQRKLLGARIETPVGELAFFTTHLAYRGDAESTREAQVAEIKRRVAEWTRLGLPAIVVGDFNAEPDRPSIRLVETDGFTARLYDSWQLTNSEGAGNTFPADSATRRIDYVFASDTSRTQAVEAEVIFGRPADGIWLSDHLGLNVLFIRPARFLD